MSLADEFRTEWRRTREGLTVELEAAMGGPGIYPYGWNAVTEWYESRCALLAKHVRQLESLDVDIDDVRTQVIEIQYMWSEIVPPVPDPSGRPGQYLGLGEAFLQASRLNEAVLAAHLALCSLADAAAADPNDAT